ncbi:electron transfer flavoprotein subunit alpha/FixB family protein [Anaerotignum propionicum]|uniref:Acryloyl-CoA reductase electron transfer subunit beta n=3 Tax=Anaerotignum propionicum TaxID=28446 RepID=A0A0X8VC96_ANAPI|nr:electron transfer flavoprotein subunit alpha/FixB family protein [Anaerotignum propionicum]AMJ42359.1 acryloyl-CoA reductase electron transfer subunit beta [Anaerotignum propionicum DSM 1682]SHF00369.1 electron transfer flavoprotein alpha subunit apoprotein [[Clostridium] propionicum DSM 1682] [Anaerotignum propionicum DSM 1682]
MSKGIFVVIEQRSGKVQNVGLELIGESTRLKEDLKDEVVAVLLGHEIEGQVDKLFHYGADKVILVDSPYLKEYVTEPYTKAITAIVNEYDPEIMLFGASSIGRDVAPRVASRVKTGLVADTTGLRMAKTEEEFAKEAAMGCEDPTRALLMTRPAFGGNIMATLMCPRTKPQMATVRPGVMKRIAKDTARTGELIKFNVDFTDADMNVEILEVVKADKKAVDLTEAKLIVSGGRGIGGAQGFDLIRDVADALGAEVGSSRACVDAGWIEKDRQVGQTGKTVRPDLYMACGISGAIQHVAGMENSELVISINKNDTAPIFEVSDLGIVGDVKVILPKLADAIRKYKAAKANN